MALFPLGIGMGGVVVVMLVVVRVRVSLVFVSRVVVTSVIGSVWCYGAGVVVVGRRVG